MRQDCGDCGDCRVCAAQLDNPERGGEIIKTSPRLLVKSHRSTTALGCVAAGVGQVVTTTEAYESWT